MYQKIKFIIFTILILFFFNYRDFLYTIKMMYFHFYNFKMLPIDPYYKIILKYSSSLDENFRFPWEWRLIPNIINWVVYEIVPCIKPSVLNEDVNNLTYCSIWSISLVNFISGSAIQLLLGFYAFKILKRDKLESILLIFTSYFLIKFLDPFGVDRISLLFLVIFLFYRDTKWSYLFIILSIFTNDKCLLFLTTYYFSSTFDLKEIKKIFHNLKFLLCFFISIFYLFFSYRFISEISQTEINFNYFNVNGFANTILPSSLIIAIFLYNIRNKLILKKFNLNKYFSFFIIIFFTGGLVVGGPGNMGRYIIFGSLCFFPLINYQILQILKKVQK